MPFGDVSRQNLVAVGSVDARSVRLWFRAERPGTYALQVTGPGGAAHGEAARTITPGNATDNTAVVVYPPPGGAPLAALTRYDFKVVSDDGTVFVGAGRFETAPDGPEDTPQRFSIGILSCHQPFAPDGTLSERNMRLLDGLPELFGKHDIKMLFSVGDQIYADSPGEASLLNLHYIQSRWPGRGDLGSWTPEEIRQAYQERHRIFWNQVPMLKLLSSCPNYAILDDHEVFDHWGLLERHAVPPFAKIVDAARSAYLDYQGSRQLAWNGDDGFAPPPALDYSFRYGTVATFVFDLRSERRAGDDARIVSPEQLARFEAFLADNQDAQVVLVVTSVPLIHLPEWVTTAGEWALTSVDFPDHWSAKANRANRDAVLRIMRTHLDAVPKQRLVVLGGDVHIGCAFKLSFVGDKKPLFYELTTSAVSNRMKTFDADAGMLGPQAFGLTPRMANGTLDVSLLRAAQSAPARNPIGGLNAGLVEFQRNGDVTNVRLKLVGYDEGHNVREEFISGWL